MGRSGERCPVHRSKETRDLWVVLERGVLSTEVDRTPTFMDCADIVVERFQKDVSGI
jgi:hypothetical protein